MPATRRSVLVKVALLGRSSPIGTRRPLWSETQRCVEGWRHLGCSEFLLRAIRFGIFDPPKVAFVPGEGLELGEIPQTEEDKAFAAVDLAEGCRSGIYKEVTQEHAARARQEGAVISSSFVVWQDGPEGRKGRFIVNLALQSKKWPKGTVKMDSIARFAMDLQQGDHLLSMDIAKGYRHFRLHPTMRDWFLFRWEGRYYQCVALPFGWGRSPLWFTQLMRPFLGELRQRHGFRVLGYLDDFLIAPSPYGVVAGRAHCVEAKRCIERLLSCLGLKRHPTKGEWKGSTTVEHLGVRVDTEAMRFYVTPHKVKKVQSLARKMLKEVRLGRRWVTRKAISHLCGVCVSLMLAMPWARFYTRSLYWDMGSGRPRDARGRVRLSHQSVRDLLKWQTLTREELAGRPMVPRKPTTAIHSDAADVGWGGTLNSQDLRPGVSGQWQAQGIWSWQDRVESISYRELKAIRLLLTGSLGKRVVQEGHKNVLLHVDNQAVVHITNSFVSASRPMMRELRRLKVVLERLGVQIRSEWIPSVANRFADALSRRFPRGDLQIRRQLRRSVQAGMQAPTDVFPYRPAGEHPVQLRRQAYAELASSWSETEVRFLCPPVDLLHATVHKLRTTQAPAVLLMPDWPHQPWHAAAMQLASRVEVLACSAQEVWSGHRNINEKWKVLMLDVNLEQAHGQRIA